MIIEHGYRRVRIRLLPNAYQMRAEHKGLNARAIMSTAFVVLHTATTTHTLYVPMISDYDTHLARDLDLWTPVHTWQEIKPTRMTVVIIIRIENASIFY